MLVHDLLLAKRGIALPAIHGLRTSVERHKARIQAEFTKSRIKRNIASLEAFRNHIEAGEEESKDGQESLYPRWIRVNTLKSTLEEQLQSTFAEYKRVQSIDGVRKRGSKCFYVDEHIPNLIALSANISLAKSEAYKNGAIIFQDKASCFPAYLLDARPEDGHIIDTCAAPGNKTTHIGAILTNRSTKNSSSVYAFEKNKMRAVTLDTMVTLAGADKFTKIHAGQDFLQVKPGSPAWREVGALLLDPSCSGSGIVGRDEMPELHLPTSNQKLVSLKPHGQIGIARRTEARKRKRDEKKADDEEKAEDANPKETMVDDDGTTTAISSTEEYNARLEALSTFQLELLEHAFKFPAARKITYSTCSIHAEENENVVMKALASQVGKQRGWRILERKNQVEGLKNWPVRGNVGDCGDDETIANACIRTNKDDEFGTMGFFVVGFVRDGDAVYVEEANPIETEEVSLSEPAKKKKKKTKKTAEVVESTTAGEEEEWGGFGENGIVEVETVTKTSAPLAKKQKISNSGRPHTFLGKSGSLIKMKGKRK